MNKFSVVFKELYQEKAENIKKLAPKIKISDSLLYKYEKDKAQPSVANLVKIANYFNCSINFLVGIDDNPVSIKFKETYNKKAFFERYTNLLERNTISHYELCNKIDISQATRFGWEHGSIPCLETLIKLAIYFKTSIDYLIGRSEEM